MLVPHVNNINIMDVGLLTTEQEPSLREPTNKTMYLISYKQEKNLDNSTFRASETRDGRNMYHHHLKLNIYMGNVQPVD